MSEKMVAVPRSLYWMFRLGLRSSFAMFRPSPARYWMNISCCNVSVALFLIIRGISCAVDLLLLV